ncbi:hypothetical protein WJX75_001226 [Coccomyxa subellipsoidea]|uniref:Uncharacterized protein n=1 Tax=Coccomyxa subellipsoidea TaxID=248742 RepID=A0ABR2YKL2_9CHLO
MQEGGSGKVQGGPRSGIPAELLEVPEPGSVVETATPSNSRERPRPPMSESIDSRATSLGVQDPPYAALETEALDKLLFGAVYSLTRVSRQGASGDAMHEVSQLVSMASQLRVANISYGEDGMSVEMIEEDEMEFMVEEVTTPGGTVREVVVHESSSEMPSAAMALKARARSEETPGQTAAAGDAAADEPLGAAGQQLELRVASVNDPAETEAAPNPFAFARATDAVAATANIVQPLPAKRRQGSLGMAREDLLSRVGNAPDLATVALGPGAAVQGTVFLDPLGSGSLAGSEASGSLGRLEKRSTERHQQSEGGKDKGKQLDAAPKLKSRTSSSSGKQLHKGAAAPAPITRLRIDDVFGEFNPFNNQKGWKIDFCCCPTTAPLALGGINSMTYPTFHEAAEELSRRATTRAGGAADRGGPTGFRNDPMGTADSGLSAIDNEFLSLNSGAGAGMMYSEFVPRRPQQAMMSPSATALPAIRSSVAQPSTSLGAATSSTASQTMPKEQSNSVVLSDEESDKAFGA